MVDCDVRGEAPDARAVAFKSLGCRVNFEEIECLRGRFVDAGWRSVDFDQTADLYVINTCTVTGLADAESRKTVRRAVRRKRAGGLVVVTGCYAQRDPEALAALDGVDLVLGNKEKGQLFEHVQRFREDRRLAGEIWVDSEPTTENFLNHGSARGQGEQGSLRTRATLKIQDGCDERCTYCIIPTVRGASVSRPLESVVDEARHLGRSGFRELALTGVNTGSWGRDFARAGRSEATSLAKLVRALQHVGGTRMRFRLNSLEPDTVTDELLDAIEASPMFARHFHVPLQHGDSAMLRRMGRNYDAAVYAATIRRIHERFPEASIGADVMVGFPGEDEERFRSGRDLIESLPLTYLHVFTYSQREGTAATRMPGHVAEDIKRARSQDLHALEDDLRRAFLARRNGSEELLLVEGKRGPRGGLTGLTGNYIRCELPVDRDASENEFVQVTIENRGEPRLAGAVPVATPNGCLD
ncbi:MAG: tRNA (N(6)-L-threonylcarbamoyladenosine(37)-C(2))-methylthiotransferase MtaB [Planctomycetes bacterium]|nr:tRNA (N(6)-L-threonylcarbamoyladenosine(37)-C(2))-methylthiotransferase MtaB [Planctomycetota bacterium]